MAVGDAIDARAVAGLEAHALTVTLDSSGLPGTEDDGILVSPSFLGSKRSGISMIGSSANDSYP